MAAISQAKDRLPGAWHRECAGTSAATSARHAGTRPWGDLHGVGRGASAYRRSGTRTPAAHRHRAQRSGGAQAETG